MKENIVREGRPKIMSQCEMVLRPEWQNLTLLTLYFHDYFSSKVLHIKAALTILVYSVVQRTCSCTVLLLQRACVSLCCTHYVGMVYVVCGSYHEFAGSTKRTECGLFNGFLQAKLVQQRRKRFHTASETLCWFCC